MGLYDVVRHQLNRNALFLSLPLHLFSSYILCCPLFVWVYFLLVPLKNGKCSVERRARSSYTSCVLLYMAQAHFSFRYYCLRLANLLLCHALPCYRGHSDTFLWSDLSFLSLILHLCDYEWHTHTSIVFESLLFWCDLAVLASHNLAFLLYLVLLCVSVYLKIDDFIFIWQICFLFCLTRSHFHCCLSIGAATAFFAEALMPLLVLSLSSYYLTH